MNKDELKTAIGYVCRKKKGNVNDLQKSFGCDTVIQFTSVGFINTDAQTWRKTSFADNYYKDMFGFWAFLINVIIRNED